MKLLNHKQLDLLERFAKNKLNQLEIEQVDLLLQQFLAGKLDEAESNELIEILAKNPESVARLDQLWLQQPAGRGSATIPNLSNDAAHRLEKGMMQQIHLSNMMGSVLKMGTRGFASVTMGLLRPFIRRRPIQARHRRSKK